MTLSPRSFSPPGPDRARAISRLDGPLDLLLIFRILVYAAALPMLTRIKLTSWTRFAGGRHVERLGVRPEAEQKTIDYVEAVLIAFRPMVRPGCLVRGLTLYHFLRQAGVDVSLTFGVGRVGDSFTAH